MIYLRENNLLKEFIVKIKAEEEKVNERGRCIPEYTGETTIRAILTDATTSEKEQYNRLSHPITHTITHRGKPIAKEEDYLVLDNRKFYVQGIENPGGLNLWTIYNVEERRDFDAG